MTHHHSYDAEARRVRELSQPDVLVLTSGDLRIPAHSSILASVSPVLDSIIDRSGKHGGLDTVIPVLGVPCEAVLAFLQFFYFSRCTEEHMDKYGIHLLTLSHVYLIPQLKQKCSKVLIRQLTIENVADLLQLSRLCDAPDLYLKCLNFVAAHFKTVEKSEGWKLLQDHDPWLELDILHFIDEVDLSMQRKKKRKRQRYEQKLYVELSEAMECLEHICREGCTSVGPYDKTPTKNTAPCRKYSTCQGLQLLIQHFGRCNKRRVNGGCFRCKRMWQLLRLHSSICDYSDSCKVPLCRQFKMRTQLERNGADARWKLLVRKVVSAKVMSALSSLQRKEADEPREITGHSEMGSFT